MMNSSKLIIAIVLVVIISVLSGIISFIRRGAERKLYKSMTGRADAKVLSRRMVEKRRNSGEDETVELKCYISYEFEVDGKTYKGHGEGSGAIWDKKHQKVCYDPDDPNNNCTKYLYDSKVSMAGSIIGFVLVIAAVGIAVYFCKSRGLF
ncbi:MAG: hypothetical protein IJ757_07485 [Clostridiales bacterium]|nr:hypothetical protein [Clostridiales bacterium]